MEVVYHRDPNLNFGDDLNEVLWRHVLPQKVLASEKLVLIGIGSILNEEHVGRYAHDKRQVVVLGSGTAYGEPPRDVSRWLIKAVRGPLTAGLLGRPETSVTDGAALLAAAPQLIGPARERSKILFVPHHRSLNASRWEEIARASGLDYLSPQTTVADVLAKFAEARLVVTEAMHGAIVADTLRIPWIPAVASPAIDEFKWRDWTRSLELPFRPLPLSASSSRELVQHQRLAQRYRAAGVDGHQRLEAVTEPEAYAAFLARRTAATRNGERSLATRGVDVLKRGMLGLFEGSVAQRSVDALGEAARAEPILSDERVFRDRLNRLQEAAGSLEALA